MNWKLNWNDKEMSTNKIDTARKFPTSSIVPVKATSKALSVNAFRWRSGDVALQRFRKE